jgi:integrase
MELKMATKISLKAVEAIPPQTVLWDSEVRGFNARRQFSDAVTYSVIYRSQDGVQRWHKIGRHPVFTPHLARQEAIRVLRAAALGQDPSGDRQALRASITIASLCDNYSADMEAGRIKGKKSSTIRTDLSRIKTHIKPQLGRYKVATINSDQIEAFVRELPQGSARRITGLLGAIFSFAIKRRLRETNPVRGVETPPENKRLRRLSDAEYQQFWNALRIDGLDNMVADVFLFLAVTGFRSGEVRGLKWSEVDLERRIATLENTKSGLSVRPLSVAAIDIIKRQKTGGVLVFDYHGKALANPTHHWDKLGIASDITPHTLRHSFASLAADLGLPDHTISGLLGHARQGITSRYLHLGDKALIEASDLVANETLRLMKA